MATHIFVRHGIFSSDVHMADLVGAIENGFGGSLDVKVHNRGYSWAESVLLWGLLLATQVKEEFTKSESKKALPMDHVVLVGHSQGGLVCRIAAAALCCPDEFETGIDTEPYIDDAYRSTARNMLQTLRGVDCDVAQRLRGLVMLATPNAGAFTFGQLSMTGRLVQRTTRLLAAAAGVVNLSDLTTDRLFRILQHVKVPRVKYLSISGSMVNRFSTGSYTDLADVPVIRRLGIRLALPNDSVVEDESTDIAQAVLPPEIADIGTQYRHIRWYRDCSQVSHTSIHANPDVQQLVVDQIRAWCNPGSTPKSGHRSTRKDRL